MNPLLATILAILAWIATAALVAVTIYGGSQLIKN